MNKPSTLSLGKFGESAAEEFLKNQGIKIIARNFRSKFGEIDLIGQEHETAVFFEVKTRKTLYFGKPYEAVNRYKITKIKKTIDFFLLKNPKYKNKKLRIDVLSLVLDKDQNLKEIKHFKNVL